MEAFTIATAKTVICSSSAILSQTKRNFSTHTPLRFLSNNNLRFDNNTNVFFVISQLNCRISYISPLSKLQRSIKAVTSKRRSDIEMALIRRRMMMNGSMPLVISIMVASLCTSSYSSARASTPEAAFVKKTVSSHDIVIFSKSYCPYCKRAKAVFKELNQAPHVIELDQREDGWGIQDALSEIVGRSTVPQVFVNGKHIGGSDDTVEAYESGKLAKILGVAKDVKNDL